MIRILILYIPRSHSQTLMVRHSWSRSQSLRTRPRMFDRECLRLRHSWSDILDLVLRSDTHVPDV